jgi:hypothetical protein
MPAERTDSSYCAVFRHHLGGYLIASGETPDQHEGRYQTKKEALLAARAFQLDKDRDPNFILDLTSVLDDEISDFLR